MDNRLYYVKNIVLQQNCKTTNRLNEITCNFFNVTCTVHKLFFDQYFIVHYFVTHNLNCLL